LANRHRHRKGRPERVQKVNRLEEGRVVEETEEWSEAENGIKEAEGMLELDQAIKNQQ
jgi:hypothetical protein